MSVDIEQRELEEHYGWQVKRSSEKMNFNIINNFSSPTKPIIKHP